MFYVYVIDRRGHLVGVLSMRDLILASPTTLLRDIMRPNVRSVPATMDQEQVARLMRKLGYLAMPVVDEQHRLVGLITFDDVADVLEEEATEDVQKMFGAGAEERLTSPWFFSFRKRVVWLLVNLVTAFMAAAVVGMFEDMIAKLAVLAFYMPIIAGMGGNASAQAMAVAVRGLALGQVDRALLVRVMYRQFLVGLLTGVIIGLTTATVAWIFHNDHGHHARRGRRARADHQPHAGLRDRRRHPVRHEVARLRPRPVGDDLRDDDHRRRRLLRAAGSRRGDAPMNRTKKAAPSGTAFLFISGFERTYPALRS